MRFFKLSFENIKELSKEWLINKLNGILYEIKALAKQVEYHEK